jgi:hypothetical protein
MMNRLAVAGPNSRYALKDVQPAGFLAGVWHGIIAPITFIVGLFKPGVRMYEVRNAGWRYDLGFLLGLVAILGGGGSQTRVCDY